jgi:hypothetical protein
MSSRRKFLTLILFLTLFASWNTFGKDYLLGTFYLKCPACGKVDKVEDGTAQHKCEKCKTQVFQRGHVKLVCPKNHVNDVQVLGEVNSVICRTCGAECCRKRLR